MDVSEPLGFSDVPIPNGKTIGFQVPMLPVVKFSGKNIYSPGIDNNIAQ